MSDANSNDKDEDDEPLLDTQEGSSQDSEMSDANSKAHAPTPFNLTQ